MRRLSKNHADADDLAQTAFIKAYDQLHTINEITSVKSWLFQIAYRCFLDDYRKSSRRAELIAHKPDDHVSDSDPALMADISSAMESLEPECRAVVMLCLAHGLSHSEAAQITGLPLGTVKSHVSRGKTKLKAFLHAYEVK